MDTEHKMYFLSHDNLAFYFKPWQQTTKSHNLNHVYIIKFIGQWKKEN